MRGHLTGSLRDIRLFVAAYEERSFTAAAEREHATQSGVSQHIRNLESGLGVELFLREKGQVAPTPAADSYYQHCIEVIRAHEAATRAARVFATGLAGEIVVGLMPTMTRRALAPALEAFVEQNPNVVVRVVEGYSGALTQSVRAGEIDFAIVPAFPGLAGLTSRLFARTPEMLVASAAAWPKLAQDRPVRLADLGGLKLVVPSKVNTRRHTLETYCATNGVRIERLLELDAMLGTLDFVARSDWVTILPGVMVAAEDAGGHLRVAPLGDPPLLLDLVLIEPSRQPMSDAATAFLALLEAATRALNAHWSLDPPDGVGASRCARASAAAATARRPGIEVGAVQSSIKEGRER